MAIQPSPRAPRPGLVLGRDRFGNQIWVPIGDLQAEPGNRGEIPPPLPPLYPITQPFNPLTGKPNQPFNPLVGQPSNEPGHYNILPYIDPTLPPVQQDPETRANLYDFLKAPLSPTAGVSQSDAAFQDLLKNISAPSSVDAVRSRVESEQMQRLLDQIQQDTKQSVGSLKSDFLDRGLGGPGQISDIEAAGLGNLYSGAAKASAGARLSFAQSELDRQKAREEAAWGAYGKRYLTTADFLKTNIDEQTKRDVALAQLLHSQELERLARKAGKYRPGVASGTGDSYSLPINFGFNLSPPGK